MKHALDKAAQLNLSLTDMRKYEELRDHLLSFPDMYSDEYVYAELRDMIFPQMKEDDPPYDPYLEGEYDDDDVGTFRLGCWMTWAEYHDECRSEPDDRHYRLEEEFYKRQDDEFARCEL